MPRIPRANLRPSYRHAIDWIAHEDNPGGEDSESDITGYLTTHLVADMFGTEPALVAADVARRRRQAGYTVGKEPAHDL